MICSVLATMTPVLASLLGCGWAQVFVDGDGSVVDFGEEARGGLSLASDYSLNVLAGKAYLPC